MRYRHFKFENFKGIADLTIDLSGGVTTLIGLNESGKTTILEAIFCFTYGAENIDALDPNMASLRDPERWIPIGSRGNFNDTIRITALVEPDDDDKAAFVSYMKVNFGVTITAIPTHIEVSEEYPFVNSRKTQGEKLWDISVIGTKDRQRTSCEYEGESEEWKAAVSFFKDRLPRIWYFPNFLFELPDQFLLEDTDVAGEERDKNNFYKLTFQEVIGKIGNGANLQTHVVDRVKSTDQTDQRNLQSILLDMSRHITNTVFQGWNRIFGTESSDQQVELHASSGESGTAYLELKIKGADGYYDLSERSLGFRWFFMFLLMTTYRGLSQENNETIVLLDEPASNLHSSAQAELLKSFEQLALTCQIVYTTHSHHMINLKWLDSAYVVKNEALGDGSFSEYVTNRTAAHTKISATKYRTFVSQFPSSTSYFQPVLDLLDYRPSELEPVPNAVLVEGKSDFYILKYFTSILELQPVLPLMPGGGSSHLDTLISLHIGWGKSFIILLDGDAEGIRQRERYIDKFGSLLESRTYLLPSLIADSTVVEIEDLIDESDKSILIDAVYGEGIARPSQKKALLQSTMELLASQQKVLIGTPSLESVARLLANLGAALGQAGT